VEAGSGSAAAAGWDWAAASSRPAEQVAAAVQEDGEDWGLDWAEAAASAEAAWDAEVVASVG